MNGIIYDANQGYLNSQTTSIFNRLNMKTIEIQPKLANHLLIYSASQWYIDKHTEGRKGKSLIKPSFLPFALHEALYYTSMGSERLVVFASNLFEISSLMAGVKAGATILQVHPKQDPIEQITTAIKTAIYPVKSLHLITHASGKGLHFENLDLTVEKLEQYSQLLQQWNIPEILLYGCNLAKNNNEFIQILHQLTGANIAASSTPTGSQSQGGNWELDIKIGKVYSDISFTKNLQNTYGGTFNIERVSVNSQGEEAAPDGQKLGSQDATITPDGRFVAFESNASNLVPDDNNGASDIFVRDRETGITTRVSVNTFGQEGNDKSGAFSDGILPSITPDGRFVAFESKAKNLAPGNNNAEEWDIFVHDRETGTTSRVSINDNGVGGNGASRNPVITPDGRFVAFESRADNLVARDNNRGAWDIFVHDRDPDGNGIFDEGNGRTLMMSVNGMGLQGNKNSFNAAISSDGRFVIFESDADNLVPGDTNGFRDIFIHDRDPDENGIFDEGNSVITRISTGINGTEANNSSFYPVLSGNDRFIVFESLASNLVTRDNNNALDIFVYDRETGTTNRVSVNANGNGGNQNSSQPSISDDGRFVGFSSSSSNFVVDDNNGFEDIFIHDRDPDGNGIFDEGNGITFRVSVSETGEEANGNSFQSVVSGNGQFVAFESFSDNLIPGDTNGVPDIFIAQILPVVTIKAGQNPLEDGQVNGSFKIQINQPVPPEGLIVNFALGGNATNNLDYRLAAGDNIISITDNSFMILPGVTTATVEVIPILNNTSLPDETIEFTLQPGSGYSLTTLNAGSLMIGNRSLIVTNTNDDGIGSLRQVITLANLVEGTDVISFEIPETDPSFNPDTGTFTIRPLSPLPTISNAVILDATSQPGYTNRPLIELDGSNVNTSSGLIITAGNTTVKGFVINRFSEGIRISNGGNNRIQGNYIGTDVTGNISLGNTVDGIFLGDGTSGNIIGGTSQHSLNLISGNGRNGIQIDTTGRHTIQGNHIGTNLSGTASLGNSGAGISIFQGEENLIGGTVSGADNLISGNGTNGIEINGSSAINNRIEGNFIGTTADGNTSLGNNQSGIFVLNNASNNTVGGVEKAGNTIAFNNGDGVTIDSGEGNAILSNSIFENGLTFNDIGIDLNNDGVTLNDFGDEDTGANTLQNYPDLLTATLQSDSIQIEGILDSKPDSTFTIQFFANELLTPNDRQGRTFLGETLATSNVPFRVSFDVELLGDQRSITATATDVNNNTSEFSTAILANAAPILDLDQDNSSGITGKDYLTRFIEGRNPVAVADIDVEIQDADSENLVFATFTLTNPIDGISESLSVNGELPGGIAAGTYNPTTGQLQLRGNASLADYETAISQIVYNNNTVNPDVSDRIINITVNDGLSNSNIAVTTITVIRTVKVSITANNPALEGEIGTFTITLDEPVEQPLIIEFDRNGSSAIEIDDYTLEPGLGITNITPNTVTIEPGVTTATLNIVTVDDDIFKPDETIQINLMEGVNYLLTENSSDILTIIDNDVAGVLLTPPLIPITSEDGDSIEFELVLSSQPLADVIIRLENTNPNEGQLSADTVIFDAENWNIPQVVTVTGVDDNIVDGDIEYRIISTVESEDENYNGFELEEITLINLDNDVVGILLTPPVEPITSEDGDSTTFEFVLSSEPVADVIINLENTNPNEGRLSTEAVIFNANNWDIPQVVTVTGVNDNIVDGDIEYQIISTVESEDDNYNGFELTEITLTNLDNDVAEVILTPPPEPFTSEDGDSVEFEFVLSSQPFANVIINLESSNPNEGRLSTETVIFNAENWDTPQTVTVTGVNDNIIDGDVEYSIITTVISEDSNYNNFNIADINLINLDNDKGEILITPTSGLTTTEAGGTANFSIVLTSQPTANVTFSLESSNPNEGIPSVSSITFTPDNWNISQIVIVTGVDDDIADGDISYSIITGTTVSNDPNYNGINPDDVSLVNADDEIAGITVTPVKGLVTTEAGGSDNFSIVLNTEPIDTVTIGIESSDTSEGIVSTDAVTFTPDNWNTPQVITVTGVNDNIDDGDIAYTIITTPDFRTTDPNYNGFNPADVNVINLDNDTAGIVVSPTTGLVTTEAGGTATFDVVLTSEPTANVILNLVSSNLAEGVLSTETLTFTSANWNNPQTVTITGVDDNIADGDVEYRIVFSNAISSDPKYNGFRPDDVEVVNIDNETPGITVSPTSGLFTSESGDTATFKVVLNTQPLDNVVINLRSDNPAEGVAFPQSLTFTPNNWNTPQVVTVTGVDDNIVDGDIEYKIITEPAISNDLNYNNRNPANVTLINLDNDLPVVDLSVSSTIAEEANQTEVTVTVTASANVRGEQTINLEISGEGITKNDYILSSNQFVIPDGQNTANITFKAVDDGVFEGDETAILTLSNPSEGILLGTATARITIIDNDSPPTLEFSQANYRVNEDGTIVGAEITINRTGDLSQVSTVEVELTEGTATAGEDFDDSLISVRFAANQRTATVTVPIVDDDLIEEDETFFLELINPSSGTIIGNRNTATVEIIDNNLARIDISQTVLSVTESGITDRYNLVLTTVPTSPVTIQFETDNQIEPITEITFDETNWNSPQIIEVIAIDDDIVEDPIHTSLITHVVISDDPNYNGLSLENVNVEITDNDQVNISVTPRNLVVSEEGEAGVYLIVLTQQPQFPVTIEFETNEQQLNPISPITFNPSNWNIPQQIIVTAIDDSTPEADEIVVISHRVVSQDDNYNGLEISSVNVEVIDNDNDAEIIVNTRNLSVTEGEITASYEIVLSSPPRSPVTIEFNTGDRINSIPRIEFNETNWNIPQVVSVVAINDNIVQGNSTENITHTVRSFDPNFNGLEIENIRVNVTDNNVAEVLITQTNNRTEVSEDGLTDTYQVVLTSQPIAEVTVSITPDSQVDLGRGAETEIQLRFNPSNWNIPQIVTVQAIDDDFVEAPIHTSTINHAVSSNDPNYNRDTPIRIDGVFEENLTVFVIDNDEPLPPGQAGVILIKPVRRIDVIEGFGYDVYKVVLNSQPTANVNININPDSQLETNQNTLTFTPFNWNVAQTIEVRAVDDNLVEGFHTGIISHTARSEDSRYNNLEIDQITANISDNDNRGDELTLSEASVISLTEFDDVVIGSPFDDILFGNEGNDRLFGEAGNDIIYGQGGADAISGREGNNVLFGGQGNDHIQGGSGNDIIFGDQGSDRIWGGDGDDQLFGGFGNDRLYGGLGTDTLVGGLGNDAFVIGFGTGSNTIETADLIVDFTQTQDVIELISPLTFSQLNILSISTGSVIQVQSTGEFLAVLLGVEASQLTEQDFV